MAKTAWAELIQKVEQLARVGRERDRRKQIPCDATNDTDQRDADGKAVVCVGAREG
jgi:hypothetical protein